MNALEIQVWTLIGAGSLMILGLLAYALRVKLGLVKAPPKAEDVHH